MEDACAAASLGVDAIGFVFADSARKVSMSQAAAISAQLPAGVSRVGVFVDADVDMIMQTAQSVGLDTVQLHGHEPLSVVEKLTASGLTVIKGIRMRGAENLCNWADFRAAGVNRILLDAWQPGQAGGTGHTCDWTMAAAVARQTPIILAGGLHPTNVADAVRQVLPWGIDVSSGVEIGPGRKDQAKMAQFVRAARAT